jgi:hypothetical protein
LRASKAFEIRHFEAMHDHPSSGRKGRRKNKERNKLLLKKGDWLVGVACFGEGEPPPLGEAAQPAIKCY